ncbi:AAA family ATPase [Burkholderia latens]|uniref:ATP-dependent nuclease n=1 Tax=Burkholderia latens TaxID=488446 RepID=UPI001C968C70|nr:AAA family ATPase [Burkholderia latens]MBY4692771.1 AAA family ATPase [Burkholderia latens]
MANQTQINQEIERINEKWENPQARNGLFGNILKSVKITSVRGLSASIEFSWPITAIAGTNGSGKTTILQLCSAAYVREQGGRIYKLGDWVRNALGDETPAFNGGSSLLFSFWNDHPTLSISYQKERTRWGYPKSSNPVRNVDFIGITTFAPRIERKDRLHVFRSQVMVKESKNFTPELLESISTVLGVPYPDGKMHQVGLPKGNWKDHLPQVKRGEYIYGEPHMGAGEQKVIRLVQALEAIPQRSLVLLEEPEITLHPDAQRGLAWYLMSLARRKGHQILVATHSADLFETLPPEARVLLARTKQGVSVIPKPPGIAAARELSGVAKSNKDLILVEDIVGQRLLREILRRFDKGMLANSTIVPVGNTDDVYRMVNRFRGEGVRAIGVRDPDIGEAPVAGMFSLPGELAPESLLLATDNIKAAETWLDGVGDAFEKAQVAGLKLTGSKWAKQVFPALAHEMQLSEEMLSDRLTLAWLDKNLDKAKALVAAMKAALL